MTLLRAALVVVVVGGALVAPSAEAQSLARPELPDPKKALVIVDDAGDVGLRISDAQIIHELVITRLRKRLGDDAVVYDGMRKSAAQMKRLLGPNAETTIQDSQLAWFDAAAKAAPWRVRVKFGVQRGQHWVTVACRKAASAAKTLDERRFTGRTFLAARDAADRGLEGFCAGLPSAAVPAGAVAPAAGEPAGVRKKPPQQTPWMPPPRRD